MSNVFETSRLGQIVLKNRFWRSATYEAMADPAGAPTEALTQLYTALARGGVGCIVTGNIGVSQAGRSPAGRMVMLDRDSCVAPLADVVRAVHDGGAPIIAQLAHYGSYTSEEATGLPALAPTQTGRAGTMTADAIEAVIRDFAAAIGRARQAGFDGVQLHAAHSFLLSAFLSPRTNRRTDDWGGSTANRVRIVEEILSRAKRDAADYPIIVKMNGSEKKRNGMTVEEAVAVAKKLEAAGCDALEISCGMADEGLYTVRGSVPWKMTVARSKRLSALPLRLQRLIGRIAEGAMKSAEPRKHYNAEAARQIRQSVSIPVIVVGGIDRLAGAEYLLENGCSDYVSMSRPLIMEPDLIEKFRSGKQTAAGCITCNLCLVSTEPLRCYYGKIDGSAL